MKRIFIAAAAALSLTMLCSCTAEQGAQTVADYANSAATRDSREVQSVKQGIWPSLSETITIGQALDSYLESPIWMYFKSDDGHDVVQCNGKCTYQNQTVETKIKFVLNGSEIRVGGFAINDLARGGADVADFLVTAYKSAGANISDDMFNSVKAATLLSLLSSEYSGGSYSASDSASSSTSGTSSSAASEKSSAPAQVTETDAPDYNPYTFRLGNYTSAEEYLHDYKLDAQVVTEAELGALNDTQVRQLLNALYARHGYTFESEDNKRFFGRMNWYTSSGTPMDTCESLLTPTERANKEVLVGYEKKMGWR